MSQTMNEVLRQRRKDRKLTQEQLAEKVHVSRQTISNWENGRANPDYEMLKTLAEVLDTTLTELLGVEEEPEELERPAELPQETAESVPDAQEQTPASPKPQKRAGWPVLVWCALGIALVLAVQSAVDWWQSRPVPSPYPPEWFMEEMPVTEGQAHIMMSVLETPVRSSGYSQGIGYRWNYQVYVRETNGVGFTIDRLVEYTFLPDGGHMMSETKGALIMTSRVDNTVCANGVCSFSAGDSSYELISGRGFLLEATDKNGNQITARCYVPYTAETSE